MRIESLEVDPVLPPFREPYVTARATPSGEMVLRLDRRGSRGSARLAADRVAAIAADGCPR